MDANRVRNEAIRDRAGHCNPSNYALRTGNCRAKAVRSPPRCTLPGKAKVPKTSLDAGRSGSGAEGGGREGERQGGTPGADEARRYAVQSCPVPKWGMPEKLSEHS